MIEFNICDCDEYMTVQNLKNKFNEIIQLQGLQPDQIQPFACLYNKNSKSSSELTILSDDTVVKKVFDEYNSSCELLFYERQSFSDLGFKKGDKMSDFVLFEFGLNQ